MGKTENIVLFVGLPDEMGSKYATGRQELKKNAKCLKLVGGPRSFHVVKRSFT